jgi:hypothetical protein
LNGTNRTFHGRLDLIVGTAAVLKQHRQPGLPGSLGSDFERY